MRRKQLRAAQKQGRSTLSEHQLRTIAKITNEDICEKVTQPLRSRMLRHTYCAARLQTTLYGKPITI
jgi:hypothetical protein